jgi:alpha-glucosidase (family GH31 glycosyl hydrolase)
MQNYSSFTVDSTNFDQLKEFTDQLHQAGRRLVLVLFGGLSNEQPPNKYRILA